MLKFNCETRQCLNLIAKVVTTYSDKLILARIKILSFYMKHFKLSNTKTAIYTSGNGKRNYQETSQSAIWLIRNEILDVWRRNVFIPFVWCAIWRASVFHKLFT